MGNIRAPIASTLFVILRKVEGNCQRLDLLVGKEPVNRRRMAKCRVDQLKCDCQSLNSAATSIHSKLLARWRAVAEREELLTRRLNLIKDSTSYINIRI